MDLNPKKFEAPFDAYEFATYHVEMKTDVLFCIMAWQESEEGTHHQPSKQDQITRNHRYWAMRLAPLIEADRTCHVVICNRVGLERGKVDYGVCVFKIDILTQRLGIQFCGDSNIIRVGGGGACVLATLNNREESCRAYEIK